MTPKDIVNNLNTVVKIKGFSGDYELLGCTIRKNRNSGEYYYQAELLEVKHGSSLLNVKLEDVVLCH